MKKDNAFYKTVIRIALPVALQTLLQSSFSVIDQLMIGKLGSSSFLPIAICNMISTLLRCMEAAVFPLYASITGAVLNTGMNYLLIFGKAGFPKMGVKGAAVASVISQLATCIVITAFFCLLPETKY